MLPVQAMDGGHYVNETAIGEAIEARYKALGLTQESLAWLAGVSISTVRNVLHGRVVAGRTWPQVEQALGWLPDSLDLLKSDQPPEEILSLPTLKSMFTGMVRANSAEARKHYQTIALHSAAEQAGFGSDDREETWAVAGIWTAIKDHLTVTEAQPLQELFRAYGLRGADANEAGLAEGDVPPEHPHGPAQPGGRAMGIAVLPLRVADLLEKGGVRDWDMASTPDGTMHIITLAVTNGAMEPSERDRRFWLELLAHRDDEEAGIPPPEEEG